MREAVVMRVMGVQDQERKHQSGKNKKDKMGKTKEKRNDSERLTTK